MKKFKKLLPLLLMMLVSAMVATACGNDSNNEQADAEPDTLEAMVTAEDEGSDTAYWDYVSVVDPKVASVSVEGNEIILTLYADGELYDDQSCTDMRDRVFDEYKNSGDKYADLIRNIEKDYGIENVTFDIELYDETNDRTESSIIGFTNPDEAN